MASSIKIPPDIELPPGYSALKPIPTLSLSPGDAASVNLSSSKAEKGFRAIIIDFEATSRDRHEATPIEIAMVDCMIDKQGVILRINNICQALNDPGFPLSDEVIAVTGITDDMVAGHLFDDTEIRQFIMQGMDNPPVMIAHNATYDRTIFERAFPGLSLPWGCTFKDIEWENLRCPSLTQINLLRESGYDFNAHRAGADTLALTWLMALHPDKMKTVYQKALLPSYTILANQFPFDAKDRIKEDHGYKWIDKVWTVTVRGEESLNAHLDMLEGYYADFGQSNKATFEETSPAFRAQAVPVDYASPARLPEKSPGEPYDNEPAPTPFPGMTQSF